MSAEDEATEKHSDGESKDHADAEGLGSVLHAWPLLPVGELRAACAFHLGRDKRRARRVATARAPLLDHARQDDRRNEAEAADERRHADQRQILERLWYRPFGEAAMQAPGNERQHE